jgi:hypothetical protein
MSDEAAKGWACKARNQLPDPQDCDWPYCGCDPQAQRVIDTLIEEGWDASGSRDRKRIASLAKIMDGLGGIDLHERAAFYAGQFEREPTDDDYYAAVCDAIDVAVEQKQTLETTTPR